MFAPPKSAPPKATPSSSSSSSSKTAKQNHLRPSSATGLRRATATAPATGATVGGNSNGAKRPASSSSTLTATGASSMRSKQTSQSSLAGSTLSNATASKSASRTSIHSDITGISNPTSTTTTTTSTAAPTKALTSVRGARTTTTLNPIRVTNHSKQTTTTTTATAKSTSMSSASSTCSSSSGTSKQSSTVQSHRVPTLAMSIRDKDQQIKLLIKERDEHKFQAELMARRAEEFEEKFMASELERSHVTSEADDEVIELRRLAQEFEDENKRLAQRLAETETQLGEIQFKLDELDCERQDLKQQLSDKSDLVSQLEQERAALSDGSKSGAQISTERAISKQKYEREIEKLQSQLVQRDEQIIQLRSSLEMRKNECSNIQTISSDLERKLKIESERSERHLKRIDEINLELKAADAKLQTKTEENDMLDRQVRQLRQDLRAAEEKLEQLSLARKKDVDILHTKLAAARRAGSTTPTCGSSSNAPAAGISSSTSSSTTTTTTSKHTSSAHSVNQNQFKTPTPQDEIVRLQMEIRDLKDQLIDREAELDCNRRDLEVMRRKMETRTLEVDCNNQELARRCQDLLEQNRQSEDTVKQLLKSNTEHSAQLMRATDDLKEANGKCIRLREEINEMEQKFDEQLSRITMLTKENSCLKDKDDEQKEQIEHLRKQCNSLNEQLSDLCNQLDVQTQTLHKDREQLARRLSEYEIELAQLRSDLANSKQDLRTSSLQTQEALNERDRLRNDLEMRDSYVKSRNDIIETMRVELETSKKCVQDYKLKLDELRGLLAGEQASNSETTKELRSSMEQLKRQVQERQDECQSLRVQCDSLQAKLGETCDQLAKAKETNENEDIAKFDEMRQKHSAEMDALRARLNELQLKLDAETAKHLAASVVGSSSGGSDAPSIQQADAISETGSATTTKSASSGGGGCADSSNGLAKRESAPPSGSDDYETQIEFLNSVVVDMQRKCDHYKSRLASVETLNIMHEFDQLIGSSAKAAASEPQPKYSTRASTLRPVSRTKQQSGSGVLKSSSSSSAQQQQQAHQATATLARPTRLRFAMDLENSGLGDSGLSGGLGLGRCGPPMASHLKPTRPISGRPYCDICLVYDLHHTIYCPKVSEKLAAHSNSINNNNNSNNNNNNNNNNNINQNHVQASDEFSNVDELFKDYERCVMETQQPSGAGSSGSMRPSRSAASESPLVPPPPPPPPLLLGNGRPKIR